MSDHLLRLANVVADHIEGKVPQKILVYQCEQLVRDLEAAESMRLRLADCSENEAPATERRTITREEFENAADYYPLTRAEMTPLETAAHFAAAWRLTVEDA